MISWLLTFPGHIWSKNTIFFPNKTHSLYLIENRKCLKMALSDVDMRSSFPWNCKLVSECDTPSPRYFTKVKVKIDSVCWWSTARGQTVDLGWLFPIYSCSVKDHHKTLTFKIKSPSFSLFHAVLGMCSLNSPLRFFFGPCKVIRKIWSQYKGGILLAQFCKVHMPLHCFEKHNAKYLSEHD